MLDTFGPQARIQRGLSDLAKLGADFPSFLGHAARAAELLACKPTTVRRYVSPVRRGRWRKSDILRHIQALTPAR
jgi:hypothetical protein